jgi:hypothetical protein
MKTLIRFLTRFPFRREPTPAAAVLVFDLPPREAARRLVRLRERVGRSGRGLRGPSGYLLNDGSVLAAELLRELPDRPLGYASFATFDQEADAVLDVVTDVGRPTLAWEFTLNGLPVDDALRLSLTVAEPGAGA